MYDRQTDQIQRINLSSTGLQASAAGVLASINSNGRYVTFESTATNLVDNDTNGAMDVFLFTISVCGDSTIDDHLGEQCDDGNENNNDGCSNVCELEVPSCTLSAFPTVGYVPLTVNIRGTGAFGVFTSIAWQDAVSVSDAGRTNTITTGYTYTTG